MMTLEEALQTLSDYRTDEVVVTTMSGNLIWPGVSQSDADLIFTAPMGGVPGTATGIALARPDVPVWAINGDGSAAMYLSYFINIPAAAPKNLIYFLMNNSEWGLIGHVNLPGAGRVDFSGIARSSGWDSVHSVGSLPDLKALLPRIVKAPGPIFVNLEVEKAMELQAGTAEYARRMGAPKAARSYGKSGIANVRAYLAGMALPAK